MKFRLFTLASLTLALSLFSAPQAQAMFVDQLIFNWAKERKTQHDEEISKFPFLTSQIFNLTAATTTKRARSAWFTQTLNHFDASDSRTFPQRYWVNSTYASGKDAPVIYAICGEYRCDDADGFTLKLAEELGGYAVTLEHRYYGDSIPTRTYSVNNLKYLSVDQALADLENFQTFIQTEKKLTGTWISVGGSYPGSLSAYYRLYYPNKVAGALASSAPVQFRASVKEYDQHVASLMSPSCLRLIQDVTAEIEEDLSSRDGRAEVKKLFNASEVVNDNDFLYVVADIVAIAVQYGERENFCSSLEKAKNPKVTFAKLGKKILADYGITPLEDTAQGNLSTNPEDYRHNGMRAWLYQSCTELGLWQVANSNSRLTTRSSRIDLEFHNGICTRMFGITGTVSPNYINKNYYKPILEGKLTNAYFTNGSEDPWQILSITPLRGNVPPTVKASIIPGGSHCSDLGGPDTPALVKAQNSFRTLMRKWLTQAGYQF